MGGPKSVKKAAWLAALVLSGCGGPPPAPEVPAVKWESRAEELRYLKSLSNPTPEQFRRREKLEALKAFDDVGKLGPTR
jgi:hypothetical protein